MREYIFVQHVIEDEHGVSAIDICTITPSLKVSSLFIPTYQLFVCVTITVLCVVDALLGGSGNPHCLPSPCTLALGQFDM